MSRKLFANVHKPGEKGPHIAVLQLCLYGFRFESTDHAPANPGPVKITGIYDRNTADMIRRIQYELGLEQTPNGRRDNRRINGLLDRRTRDALAEQCDLDFRGWLASSFQGITRIANGSGYREWPNGQGPMSPVFTGTMCRRSHGPIVNLLKALFIALDAVSTELTLNGRYDEALEAAVGDFQDREGIPRTGQWCERTRKEFELRHQISFATWTCGLFGIIDPVSR